VIRRLRTGPKAPLAVAGILSVPLFLSGLMAMSLAVEKPSVHESVRKAKLVRLLGDPTGSTEARIWLLAIVPPVALLALGVVLLLLEVVKGARPGSKFLMDHLLSLIVFGAAAAEFVMWPKFGNSTYFLLVLLAMADFLGGIAQRTRRRVTYVAETTVAAPRKAKRQAEASADDVASERKFEPVIAPQPAPVVPPAPSAQSVAESVLTDHPAPKPVQSAPSPEIPSPHLQPGNGTPSSPDTPLR
jgi:hypothetical protein